MRKVEPAPLHVMPSPRPRRRARWVVLGVGIVCVALLAIAVTFIPLSSDRVKDRIVAALSDRLDSDVQLESLSLRTWPGLRVDGSGLIVRHRNRPDVPPLITVKHFAVETSVAALWRHRITSVVLDGLDIEIPPERTSENQPDATAPDATSGSSGVPAAARDFLIERLETSHARLAIIPSEREKPPKVWSIHVLTMRDLSTSSAMPFRATLTNGIPPGEIETSGTFGPWQRDEPGRTPLQGVYTFEHADLSVFHGISGMLHSVGSFSDRLNRIDVTGTTDCPDFTIDVSGHPFPLKTTFHTIVDGTNGDTILQRIDAQFLSSSLVASGKVVDTPGADGRTVSLEITMNRARLEDVMRMAVKAARPPMVGAITMKTAFLLPPGQSNVVDRLRLNGRFAIANARFTSAEVQKKIDELSHRSRGRTDDTRKETVVSDFNGTFRLGGGRLTLPTFAFAVPGATVKLNGQYAIAPESVDFRGDLLMDARVSETQSGIKRWLLKAVDPFFRRKGGGSSLPIKITGKRSDPSFGIDMHRVFHRNP